MAEFDLIIRGGTVIDGTRMPRYRADVGIREGRIAKIGNLKSHQAKKVIDAGGLNVAPGFVDLHTQHSLRCSALLGSLLHYVEWARHHLARHR
jgi:N-acyl-D-amino-acid deacylase